MTDLDLNRRQFVAATAALACATVACECCAAEAEADAKDKEQKEEKEDKENKSKPQSKSVDAGALTEYAKDGITDKFAKADKVMLIRHEGKLYAPSAICSHKRCTIKVKDAVLTCPCHGSKFTNLGVPTKGPAKVPLFRYAISTNDKGNVIVDKTRQFEEKEWETDGAFIKVG